jgi:hypothetical protein
MGRPKSEARARKLMLPELGHSRAKAASPVPAIPPPSCLEVFLVSAVEHQRGPGSQSSPSFPQALNPGERVPGLGSAKPMACDAIAGSDLDAAAGSGTMDRREDGTVQPPVASPS